MPNKQIMEIYKIRLSYAVYQKKKMESCEITTEDVSFQWSLQIPSSERIEK